MCIFTQPVISVRNTRIFARLSGHGTQFLAYQMNYESRDPNAMILPLPVKRTAANDGLRFIDLEYYTDFFDDLDQGFPFHETFSVGCGGPMDPSARLDLEVFEVGSYIASFVPTFADFDRLDSRFTLPDEVWDKLPGYEGFGFAVFQLAAGSLKPHPMAMEYQSEKADLFFPTVHIHDGEIHDSESFDHVLYMQHAGLDSKVFGYQNSFVDDVSTGMVRSKYQASRFCDVKLSSGIVDGNLLVHRKILLGDLPNEDTVVSPSGDPVRPSINLRPWISYAPWLALFAALGWFLNRRSRLKKNP